MKLLYILFLSFILGCSSQAPIIEKEIIRTHQVTKTKETKPPSNRQKLYLSSTVTQDDEELHLETLSRRFPVKWKEFGINSFAQAFRENKIVILYIKSENDKKSIDFENKILSERKVSQLLNNNFIPIKVDIEADHSMLPARLTKEDIPLLVFLTSDGEFVTALSVEISVDKLSVILYRLSIM